MILCKLPHPTAYLTALPPARFLGTLIALRHNTDTHNRHRSQLKHPPGFVQLCHPPLKKDAASEEAQLLSLPGTNTQGRALTLLSSMCPASPCRPTQSAQKPAARASQLLATPTLTVPQPPPSRSAPFVYDRSRGGAVLAGKGSPVPRRRYRLPRRSEHDELRVSSRPREEEL